MAPAASATSGHRRASSASAKQPGGGGGVRRTGRSTLVQKFEAPLQRFYAWKSQYQYLGRYSVEKLCAFHHYQETTPLWRVAAVIAMAPLPVFTALLAMDVVPMNDPRAGAAANGVAFARSVIAHVVLPSAILLSTKQALQLTDRLYSIPKIFRIGLCVSLVLEFVCVGAAFVWRFPVPFREVTAIPLFVVCVVFFNWYFGWDELRKKIPKLRHYLPMVTMQLSMYYSFLCLAVAFAYFSSATQIALVLLFPGIKLAVKRAVWTQAQKLDDLSTDVTICFVELTGALYQTVCLQHAKSQALQYVILFSDLFQALYEVRAYLFHEYITDGVSTVHTAVRIVLGGVFPGAEERPQPQQRKTSLRTLLPSFLATAGGGGSVFLKPKMVRASQSRRLLDLNQYRVEVDLPCRDGPAVVEAPTTPAPHGAETPPQLPLASIRHDNADEPDEPAEAEDATEPTTPTTPTTEMPPPVEIAPARRRSLEFADAGRRGSRDLTVLSARSAVSSSPSLYQRHSTMRDDSAYGISRATTGSASVASTCVSPAQEADGPAVSPSRPRMLPPIRRASSHLASLGHISLGYEASSSIATSTLPTAAMPKTTAFSVYDLTPMHAAVVPSLSPSPTSSPVLAHRGSIIATLMDVEAEQQNNNNNSTKDAVRRSSIERLRPRASKRGSAIVHPDAESQVLDPASPPRHAVELLVEKSGDADTSRSRDRANTSKGSKASHAGGERVTRVMIDGIQLPRKDQARVLEQTLQLLFSCEVLVFVEFLEVLLPTLYGLVVGALWPLHNARYNLLFISMDYDNMLEAVGSSLAYAALESLSLGVLVVVMKKRYGISALHLLAFVLEKYWKVLYGKLIGSFLVVWLTLSVHLGTDFTFTFDYGVILERFGSARFQ